MPPDPIIEELFGDTLKTAPTPRARPPLTPAAEKVINALRERPELLVEVAQHFAFGWPTADLVGPWRVSTHYREANFVRTRVNETDVAGVSPFRREGHDGSQWEAAILLEDVSPSRRIFDDPFSAAQWVDAHLAAAGLLLHGETLTDPAMLDALEVAQRDLDEAQQNVEAALDNLTSSDDDIPF